MSRKEKRLPVIGGTSAIFFFLYFLKCVLCEFGLNCIAEIRGFCGTNDNCRLKSIKFLRKYRLELFVSVFLLLYSHTIFVIRSKIQFYIRAF
jgi:hypothetical protein